MGEEQVLSQADEEELNLVLSSVLEAGQNPHISEMGTYLSFGGTKGAISLFLIMSIALPSSQLTSFLPSSLFLPSFSLLLFFLF